MTNASVISQIQKQEFQDARRVQESILAGVEKHVLIWIAKRLPASIHADHLTVLGFAAMILAGAAYASAGSWPRGLLMVNVLLALNWFGDSLDGTGQRFGHP